MKAEVYSWRVSADLKTKLEVEARRRQIPVAALLHLAVQDLFAAAASDEDDDARQRRLQTAALKCVGAFAGGDPNRSTNARETVRRRLRKRHET